MVEKWFFRTVLLILCLSLLSQGSLLARERLGVLEFGGVVGWEFKVTAINRLTQILMELDRFEVMERRHLELILREQQFQLTGLVDVSTAVSAGKLLGVEKIFVGTIDHLSSHFEEGTFQAQGKITVKIIDVMTGTLIHVIKVSGNASSSNSTAARHQAIESAMGEVFIIQLREKFAITSIITHVSGNIVYLLGGQDMGIKEGYRYEIVRSDVGGQAYEESFHREIGLLEILEVTSSQSRGKIIYAKEPVQENDVVVEVPYHTRSLLGLGLKTLNVHYHDQREAKIAPLVEITYTLERPFDYNLTGLLGLSFHEELFFVILGLAFGKEISIIPGNLYLNAGLGGGVLGGGQPHEQYDFYNSGIANAGNFYLKADLGFKYYLKSHQGARLQLGATGLYGGALNSWQSEQEHIVNKYVQYPNLSLSGGSLFLSLSFPIKFSPFSLF